MDKFQQALEACLAECLDSETPFLCISLYCARLGEREDWTPEEIDQLGVTAWRELYQMLHVQGELTQ